MIKLIDIISEIRIVKPPRPIKIGNRKINPSTNKPGMTPSYSSYSWEEALSEKILSKRTLVNVQKFFINILGITPELVRVETNENMRKSYYIFAYYNEQPIVLARRETESSAAGQTKVYSEKVVAQLSYLIDDKHGIAFDKDTNKFILSSKQNFVRGPNLIHLPPTKENILKALKIND